MWLKRYRESISLTLGVMGPSKDRSKMKNAFTIVSSSASHSRIIKIVTLLLLPRATAIIFDNLSTIR